MSENIGIFFPKFKAYNSHSTLLYTNVWGILVTTNWDLLFSKITTYAASLVTSRPFLISQIIGI